MKRAPRPGLEPWAWLQTGVPETTPAAITGGTQALFHVPGEHRVAAIPFT